MSDLAIILSCFFCTAGGFFDLRNGSTVVEGPRRAQ